VCQRDDPYAVYPGRVPLAAAPALHGVGGIFLHFATSPRSGGAPLASTGWTCGAPAANRPSKSICARWTGIAKHASRRWSRCWVAAPASPRRRSLHS